MAPVALWAALAVGLQLSAAGHGMTTQFTANPNSPESGGKCQLTQYYDDRVQRCCSQCQPGHHVKAFCTESSDTVCTRCENNTYTQLWNRVTECFSCSARCSHDQVETQACTWTQNRICMCKPGSYCMLKKQEGCRLCVALRKCRPGFGVAKPGTATSDVVCAPCAPGTFSDTTSPTDTRRPHRICNMVAIPGNANMDTVSSSGFSPPQVALQPTSPPQPVATTFQHTQPTPGPGIKFSVPFLMGPSPPAEELHTGSISLPVGLIVGVTVFCLLVIGLVNIVIMSQKKKKLSCLQREAKVPHVPADKARGEPGLEQQHLLTTAPSSSSSSLESSTSSADRRTPTRSQPPTPSVDKAPGPGEAQASCRSSEPNSGGPGSPGTQVNVTCIVNVYSSSDPGSPCSSPAGPAMEDTDGSPSGLSMDDERVPLSKEESPFESHPGPSETALQNPEKSLPLGVPDDGLKPS